MKINILLPYKENFDTNKLSSVSITILNNFKHSQFRKNIRIFGKEVIEPALPENFIGIKNSKNIFKSKNINLVTKMCEYLNSETEKKQIIEIHNRPLLFHNIFKKLENSFPVNIFFHNNPLDMSGSKTLLERKKIVMKAGAVFCVSRYIKDQFLIGFDEKPSNVYILHNGVERIPQKFPIKKKEILFVGRLVEEKGVKIFIEAVARVANHFSSWKFCIIGSSQLGSVNEKSVFANKCKNSFLKIGSQAYFSGYLNHNEVQNKMKQASIVVFPSLWEEPYGLVVAEAMSNGAAIITTVSGGIPEIIGENGILIRNINKKKLTTALVSLMKDEKKLKKYQQLSWKNFNHYASYSSKKLDKIRMQFF